MAESRESRFTFLGVQKPLVMKNNIEENLFFKRCEGTKDVNIDGTTVTVRVTTSLSRQELVKKVSQNFKACGIFSKYTLYDAPKSTTSAPSVPLVAPVSTIALPMDVETIKTMARSMTHAECHALAFYFNARCAATPVIELGIMREVLADKKAAAHIFQLPADQWDELLTQRTAGYQTFQKGCECNCGCCNNSQFNMCWSCGKWHCIQCVAGCKSCHYCEQKPKDTTLPLPKPRRLRGLDWYFNSPHETANCFLSPATWCKLNRDTKDDPIIVDILDVYKSKELVAGTSRHARPMFWQRAFHLRVQFADNTVVAINLLTFIMNPTWKSHYLVKFAEDWVLDPGNMTFIGSILKIRQVHVRREPSPRCVKRMPTSTVQIEEIEDEEMTAMKKRSQEATADDDTLGQEEMKEMTASLKRQREEKAEQISRQMRRTL